MRWQLAVCAAAGGMLAPTIGVGAQSAFGLCADSSAQLVITSRGPVRGVLTNVGDLRVCLAAEGFTDSTALHPREWPNRERLLVFQTRIAGDEREMQEARLLTTWTKNRYTLAVDSTARAWRAAVLDLTAAQWDAIALANERRQYVASILAIEEQRHWILAQLDSLRHHTETARLAARAREAAQREDESVKQAQANAELQVVRAQRALALIPPLPENESRIQAATQAVRNAESLARSAGDRALRPQGAGGAAQQGSEINARELEAKLNRILVELDADNQIAAIRAVLLAIDAEPDPQIRIRAAAATIKALLGR